jgi:hypothetical protein
VISVALRETLSEGDDPVTLTPTSGTIRLIPPGGYVRQLRLLTAFAVAAALLLPAVAPSSASAESAAAKPHRTITAKIVKVSRLTLQIRAHVRNYPHRHTFLDKKRCALCTWRIVARKKTSLFGRVFYPVGAPVTGRWYFRVGTPETRRFATSYSPKFYTLRI